VQLEQYIVTKSNELVNAQYRLTTYESRIILLLASKVQPKDEEFKRYIFTVKEIASLIGLSGNSVYEDLKRITYGLLDKKFTIISKRTNKKDSELQTNWLASAEYIDGAVELEFSSKLKPYFLQLKEKFTSYKLNDVIRLKNMYSFRIYELLKQYENIRTRVFDLEELRTLLMSSDEYPKYGNFKQKVLLIAQKELAEKTDLFFDFEEIKSGKKITQLKFTIFSKMKDAADIPFTERIELSDRLINVFGLKPARAQKVMREYEIKYIENTILVVEENMFLGKVQNVPAYTQAALKDNYVKTYSPFELDCMRSLKTKEEKDEYYELRKSYLKETGAMINEGITHIYRAGNMSTFMQEFMSLHPDNQTLISDELLDFSTPLGQSFARYVFQYQYPDFTFENYYKRNKNVLTGSVKREIQESLNQAAATIS
jgi:plasmid replication initiation protein